MPKDPAAYMADLAGQLAMASQDQRYIIQNGNLTTSQENAPSPVTLAQLPATANNGEQRMVTDLQGGPEVCFFDASTAKWRRFSDRSLVN